MANPYLDIYETFNRIRALNEADGSLTDAQAEQQDSDTVPYTSQDTLMTNTLESAKQEFGADFNKIKNPMLYYPKDGDITLSGIIPEMNDARFQFRYKVGDGAGCYVWSNPYLPISDKTIQLLSKVNGVCKNWRDEISKSEDCKPSNYKDPDDMQDNQQGQASEIGGVENADTGSADSGAEQTDMTQINEYGSMVKEWPDSTAAAYFRNAIEILREAVNPVREYTPGDDMEILGEGLFRNGDDMELVDGGAITRFEKLTT